MSRSGVAKKKKARINCGLNPSFSGCPALGPLCGRFFSPNTGLNPSFSGCPALGALIAGATYYILSLNPSFSGCPALGMQIEADDAYFARS